MKLRDLSVHSSRSRRARLAYPLLCVLLSGGAVVAAADPAVAAPPDGPVQPTVVAQNSSIQVSFVAPSDGGSPITGYTAACTSADGAPGTQTGVSSPIVVSGLTNGDTYTCSVFATNADGDGIASPVSDPAVPSTVPDAPAAPTLVAGNASIEVDFVAAFDGGSAITGYTATCTSSDGGVAGFDIGALSPILVTALTNGKTYSCTVLASNVDGDGAASPASGPAVPSTVPDAPAAPTVVAANASIAVTFVAPFDGGSVITLYTATCVSSDGGPPGSATGTVSPIVVSTLTNTNTYSCTVFASNVNGDGAASVASGTAVPDTVPTAPAKPGAVGGNTSVRVTFAAPVNAGTAITGYRAICSTSSGGPSNATGISSPITVTGLHNGSTYTCTVSASNASGRGPESAPSAAVLVATKPSRPSTPTVVAGSGRLVVTVHAPANGGAAITAYRARCISTNGGGSHIATSKTTKITVTGLVNGFTFRCVAYASNARGTSDASPLSRTIVPFANGYRMFSGDGGIFTFGASGYYGSAVGRARSLVISMATTRDNKGYWLTTQSGEVFNFGDATFYGSMGTVHLNKPVVGIAASPTGRGYWLVASDGGIFAFGDARFFGSTGNIKLNQPIVGMTPTASGRGYWFVAADGGLFSYGDAHFYGSASGRSSRPIVGMATSATGHGYWIATAAGQVFSFGDAPAFRSGPLPGLRLQIMGIVASPSGRGYWLGAADGGVFNFGDAPYYRWPGPLTLARIIRGISR